MKIFNFFRNKEQTSQPVVIDSRPTMVCSILTGIPVQILSGGHLTGAGSQERGWCNELLRDMKKKKYITKNVMGMKVKITRQQVLDHLKYLEI